MIDAKVGTSTVRVWEGDQRSLFMKYASKRKKSLEVMKKNLEILMEDLE
jgi:hypothetical protein